MKHFFVLIVSVFVISCSAFAKQEKYVKHKVEKGQTVTQIAKIYKVTPFDIYKLNPDAQNGLQENTIILVPGQSSNTNSVIKNSNNATPVTSNSSKKTHEVAPKETLFGIAKKYEVSVTDLEKENKEALKEGLKTGQVILIPEKRELSNAEKRAERREERREERKEKKEQAKAADDFVIHEVQSKETKYAIAKKYGITVQELEKQNPEVKDGLPLGFRLKIKGGNGIAKAEEKPVHEVPAKNADFKEYEVKPKETLYSLSRSFGLKEDELVALNPDLKNGVKVGMMLKVPAKASTAIVEEVKDSKEKEYRDLTNKINNKDRKELVMLLPFNLSKIASDTVNSQSARLKKDKFLNMTLDFYSGALMAIDSAKRLGLNVNIKIFDSQETKNSSNVAKIINANNNFANVDAVIGPFYQSNIEATAELLKNTDVPLISPLSKEPGKLYSNLFQSMPSSDYVKQAMLDYLRSKNGNVIAIVDAKKGSSKKFITDHYAGVRFVQLDDKGAILPESLKGLLSKDKANYVILETERANMILNATNLLLAEIPNYDIKLVTLDKNETFDYDEISSSRLTKLNLHYPSMSRDNDAPGVVSFFENYKKKNNIFPNQFAVRGFDVTFDVLLRLSQRRSFTDTVEDIATEQMESKFVYEKKTSGGYFNKGVYILYYDTDLTVKEAK
ncbi:LysM peptidoglycan-binding domain-containing protein [Flavobacterium sp. '19STA2R22 D10 B1']|uniref:LysM peptidoglycan-binding domain-containing protein n=1 Tax=Flavobacterium aerium TaxID=3037261 RepID=UPI00278C1173|nr:LysM peptidoglycan-binding domain-containing protein [Flavobacterium sp. '19STA2R22 D10 B1']